MTVSLKNRWHSLICVLLSLALALPHAGLAADKEKQPEKAAIPNNKVQVTLAQFQTQFNEIAEKNNFSHILHLDNVATVNSDVAYTFRSPLFTNLMLEGDCNKNNLNIQTLTISALNRPEGFTEGDPLFSMFMVAMQLSMSIFNPDGDVGIISSGLEEIMGQTMSTNQPATMEADGIEYRAFANSQYLMKLTMTIKR